MPWPGLASRMHEKQPLIEYLPSGAAADKVTAQGAALDASEYAVVRNLGYVFAPAECYPLAPHTPLPLDRIVAIAVDMDGTSTSTEPLAIHALEEMVRRFTGRSSQEEWAGLDKDLDYPHVIGNSNYRHTEFLLQRYAAHMDRNAFCRSFIEAVVWTRSTAPDADRVRGITRNARSCGLGAMLDDAAFRQAVSAGPVDEERAARRAAPFVAKYADHFQPHNETEHVAAALDLYYARYHFLLGRLACGQGDAAMKDLPGNSRQRIEPMPGYGVFLCMMKGWLGAEAEKLLDLLVEEATARWPEADSVDRDAARHRLRWLGKEFRRAPARIGLVTASIAYETHAVMKRVISRVREEATAWPVSQEVRHLISTGLEDHHAVFDAIVTASDAHEARLKPHRDLYSIALYRMGISPHDFPFCMGLEDTEPGIVSLRAAGIGAAIALPNHDTSGQEYRAATRIVHHGLPELLLHHHLFLRQP